MAKANYLSLFADRRPFHVRHKGKLIAGAIALLFVVGYMFSGGGGGTSGLSTTEAEHVASMKAQFASVDMHMHTTESDGDRTAEEQIKEAKARGMATVWVTDHDMIRDLPRTRELQDIGQKLGVEVVFGVEITVSWQKKEHHLLGYFPNSAWKGNMLTPAMTKLQKACAEVKDSRENRNQNLVKWLNEALGDHDLAKYYTVSGQIPTCLPLNVRTVGLWARDNAQLTDATSLGRPHFSKYLEKKCGVNKDLIFGPRGGDGKALISRKEIDFDWQAHGKSPGPGHVLVDGLMHSKTLEEKGIVFNPMPIVEAINAINAAGGKAVVAHMPTLGSAWYAKFAAHVPALVRAGLWGIETLSSEISPENHALLDKIVRENGLHETGGSDNHGTLKPYAKLGRLFPDREGSGQQYAAVTVWAKRAGTVSHQLGGLATDL